jgi:hypothetical protein
VTIDRGEADERHWTVGADAVERRRRSGDWVRMPTGRLHAVSGDGLVFGTALCLAQVTLLDPRDWRWPDDGAEEWPLCWVCLALTCALERCHGADGDPA